MSAMEMLHTLIDIDPNHFSKIEILMLEAELFCRICDELTNIYNTQNLEYLRSTKANITQEKEMLTVNFIRCIINDIISTEEYSLLGIANYAQIPEDLIYDLALGKNNNPSLELCRKILELHRSVRCELYREIVKKITKYYSTESNNNISSFSQISNNI